MYIVSISFTKQLGKHPRREEHHQPILLCLLCIQSRHKPKTTFPEPHISFIQRNAQFRERQELWVLHGWSLGTGNPVYPLSCWEQLSFSGSLLSPVKQAHNSHWRWWDYVLLSGEKQRPSLDRGWEVLGPPWCPISEQPFVCLSAEHSEASFKRTIQPWALVPWLLHDNFWGSRLIASNVGCNEKASKCPWRSILNQNGTDNGFPLALLSP